MNPLPFPLEVCPGTLAPGFFSYSPSCLRNMFNGRKVSPVLPYDPPQQNEEVLAKFMENRKHISISGVQEKLSLVLEKNQLRLSKAGEQGTYILKPIPRDFRSEASKKTGHSHQHDFIELARRIGVSNHSIEKLLKPFVVRQPLVESLIQRSFLSDSVKRGYFLDYQTRRNYLTA